MEDYKINLTSKQIACSSTNNIVYYSLMLPVAVFGNIFTLSAVSMVLRVKKSIPNMLIGILAFADLTSVFTCHIIAIVSMAKHEWVGGTTLCRFQSVMTFTYFKLGFFSKTCISIDRFIALKYPLKYRSIVTMKRVTWIMVFNTLFSIGSSALTWIVDPEYIMELETWPMCTNNFAVYTNYKLAIVIGEGTIFLGGVVIFFVGNITVVKVMLELGSKIKQIKEKDDTLKKLHLMHLSVVTSASAGFTDLKKITEISESNNNLQDEGLESGDEYELQTPLAKRAKVRMAKPNINKQNGLNKQLGSKLQVPERHSTPEPLKKTPNAMAKRYSTGSLPANNEPRKERKKSLFKKVVEMSAKTTRKKKENRQKKELQFAKLVMVIVTVFVILWIPYMFTIYYEHSNRTRLHPLIVDISMKLVFANACLNPILYGLFNANFRKAYVYYIKIICFYLSCKSTEKPDGKNMPWSVVTPGLRAVPALPASPAK
ncbi:D(2) dopamine receptor-like [Watersipora subatra]|uniref:D(2) dopamine receptor-like n=1 Tax=Watersipora subatra TaxID=2589382 RepID=UPI00355B5A69